MPKHTPGPWEVIMHSENCAGVRIGDVVVEGAYRGGDYDLLSLANARLIAAAPDLYNAVEELVDELEHILKYTQGGLSVFNPWDRLRIAKDALHKARGGQPIA